MTCVKQHRGLMLKSEWNREEMGSKIPGTGRMEWFIDLWKGFGLYSRRERKALEYYGEEWFVPTQWTGNKDGAAMFEGGEKYQESLFWSTMWQDFWQFWSKNVWSRIESIVKVLDSSNWMLTFLSPRTLCRVRGWCFIKSLLNVILFWCLTSNIPWLYF